MSAKDNFAQAFKELLNGSDNTPPAEAESTNAASAAPVSAFTKPTPPAPTPAAPAPAAPSGTAGFGGFSSAPAASSATAGFGGFSSAPASTPAGESFSSKFGGDVPPPSYSGSGSFAEYEAPAGTTTIASGTVVVGEIHSKGDLNLFGEIKGNVETIGNVQIGGRIMGNVSGNDMIITSSAVKGNVAAQGSLQLDGGSVVMGDLKAREAQFDGQVKGNLTVEGLAHFFADTVLLGNVSVGSLIIDEGARLRGEICTGSRDRFDIADPFQ